MNTRARRTLIALTAAGSILVATGVFAHAPTNPQAPFAEPGVNPGATQQAQQGKGCDGNGLDTLDACFGG